jgi:hypothetical protein
VEPVAPDRRRAAAPVPVKGTTDLGDAAGVIGAAAMVVASTARGLPVFVIRVAPPCSTLGSSRSQTAVRRPTTIR